MGPLALLVSPPLPSLEWLEVMPVLADMLPTLLESSMSPRGLLMLSPRLKLMPTTPMPMELTVLAMAMVPMVLAMPDTLPPMPTTERGLLMLSPRLMLMPTTLEVMVLAMAMVDSDTEPMVPTPMPMVPTTERGLLMPSPRLMPTMELMDMVLAMLVFMVDTDTGLMVPTPTPMVLMPTASKMSSSASV